MNATLIKVVPEVFGYFALKGYGLFDIDLKGGLGFEDLRGLVWFGVVGGDLGVIGEGYM